MMVAMMTMVAMMPHPVMMSPRPMVVPAPAMVSCRAIMAHPGRAALHAAVSHGFRTDRNVAGSRGFSLAGLWRHWGCVGRSRQAEGQCRENQ
jgi:hypothetical protein